MSLWPRGFAVIAGGAWLVAACSLANSLDGYAGPPKTDAGVDAAVDAGDATPACTLAHLPPPIEGTFGGGLPLTFALRQFAFALPDEGFDLDNQCSTCDGDQPPSCVNTFGGTPRCVADGVDGRDNAGGAYGNRVLLAADDVIKSLDNGNSGILFRIEGWSRSDDRVDVEFLMSSEGLEPLADGGRPLRLNDGTDTWRVDRVDERVRGLRSKSAWIIDNVLYAKFDDMRMYMGKLVFTFVHALFKAEIKREPLSGLLALERGLLVGRSTMRDALAGLQRYVRFSSVCSPEIAAAAREEMCALADLAATPADDGQGKPCAAISFAMKFSAGEAREGQIIDSTRELFPCGEDFMGSCD